MQDSLPAGGVRLYREGVEPSGPLRKVSGHISLLPSRTCPVASGIFPKEHYKTKAARYQNVAQTDIIGSYFTFDNDIAIFSRQLRQLGVTLPWVGPPTTVNAGAVKLAGVALWGTYGVADYAVDSSAEAREFAALYGEVSKIQPDIYPRNGS